MKELSSEQKQSIEEAGKDEQWAARLRSAATWEDCAKLLAEKGVEASDDLKAAFEAGKGAKAGELADDEMENVTGGWTNVFNCPKEYSYLLCDATHCPHVKQPSDENEAYCDLGYWAVTRPDLSWVDSLFGH